MAEKTKKFEATTELDDSMLKPSSKRIAKKETTPSKEKIDEGEAEAESEDDSKRVNLYDEKNTVRTILKQTMFLN